MPTTMTKTKFFYRIIFNDRENNILEDLEINGVGGPEEYGNFRSLEATLAHMDSFEICNNYSYNDRCFKIIKLKNIDKGEKVEFVELK